MEEIKIKLKDEKIIFDVDKKTYFIDLDALLSTLVNKEMYLKVHKIFATKINIADAGKT